MSLLLDVRIISIHQLDIFQTTDDIILQDMIISWSNAINCIIYCCTKLSFTADCHEECCHYLSLIVACLFHHTNILSFFSLSRVQFPCSKELHSQPWLQFQIHDTHTQPHHSGEHNNSALMLIYFKKHPVTELRFSRSRICLVKLSP